MVCAGLCALEWVYCSRSTQSQVSFIGSKSFYNICVDGYKWPGLSHKIDGKTNTIYGIYALGWKLVLVLVLALERQTSNKNETLPHLWQVGAIEIEFNFCDASAQPNLLCNCVIAAGAVVVVVWTMSSAWMWSNHIQTTSLKTVFLVLSYEFVKLHCPKWKAAESYANSSLSNRCTMSKYVLMPNWRKGKKRKLAHEHMHAIWWIDAKRSTWGSNRKNYTIWFR